MTIETIYDKFNEIISEFISNGFKVNPQPMRGCQSVVDCTISFSDGDDTYIVSVVDSNYTYGKPEKDFKKVIVEKFSGFGFMYSFSSKTFWVDSKTSGSEVLYEKKWYRYSNTGFFSDDIDDIFDCIEKRDSRDYDDYDEKIEKHVVKPENAALVLKKVPGYKRVKADSISKATIYNKYKCDGSDRVLEICFNNGKKSIYIPMTSISDVKYGLF